MSIKITIGQKFSFAFLIILLLMALTLGITIKSYNSVITNLEATNEDASMQGAAGNVRFSIAKLIMFANDYIITEKDYYRQMFEQQHMRVEDYQKKLRMFCFSSREFAIVDSIAADVDSIYAYAHRIFAISKPQLSSKAATLMEMMDHKFGDAVSRKTTEIFDIVFSRIEELRILSARSKEQMLHTIYTVFFLALLVSLAFVYLSVQRIVKPIKTIVKAADEIAKGDYTQRPVVTTHDEVALLARSFCRMTEAVEKSHLELYSSNRFTENIYAAVPSGLLVFGEAAKVLSVNKSFCELFNMQYQQIVGQPIDDVLQLIGISQKCKDAVAAREPFRNLECVCPAAAKGEMTLNMTLSGIRNAIAEEKEVLLVIEDITERRIAEEMIKKSEVLFRTTLYSIGDAVITTDEHGIVQRLNPVAEHLTGWKESDAQGKSIEDVFNIINEETRNKVENPVKKVLREGAIVGLANHTLLISKDGIEAPIADSGAPIKNETGEIIGVVLVFRDQTEEREKQKALELSNARLKEAQRMAHIGNWELDLQKNELYWCDEIFRIFEIDPAEFGASYEAFLNTVHPDDREFVNNAYTESVKNKTPYSIDHRLLMKDGRIKYVHEQCETYYDDLWHPIRSVGTVQDITERVKANAVIAEQAEQLNVILATTSDGFWVVDQFGKIIDVNDAYCKMSGYRRDEILRFSISDLDAKESAEETADYIKKIIKNGSGIFESVHKTKDGKYLLVEVSVSYSPSRKQFLGFCRDITERKRAGEELAEREKRYRALFNLSPSGIVLEDVEGNTVEVNEAYCKSIGYSPEELVGRNVRMVASPEQIPHIEDNIALLRSGETLQHVVEDIKKDGTRCWMELRETLIKLPDGREGFLVVTNDITDRKHSEEELLKIGTAIEQTADSVVITDRDGIIQYVNTAFLKIFGYTKEEALGKTPRIIKSELHPPQFYEDLWKTILSGEVFTATFINKRKDGELIYEVKTITPIKDKEGNITHFVSTAKEITEQRRAEEAMRKKDEHHKNVIENIFKFVPEGVLVLTESLNLLKQNKAFDDIVQKYATLLGYTEQELVEKIIEQLRSRIVSGDSNQPEADEPPAQEMHIGKKDRLETCPPKADGRDELILQFNTARMFLAAAAEEEAGIVVSLLDITERKKLEKKLEEYRDHLEDMVAERTAELRQSEEKFRALAENSEDVIMRFNSSHQHLYVNPIVEKIMEIKADDYIGKTYQQLGLPDELVKLWDETLKKTFLTKKMNRTEFELPNGIWIDWIIIPEFDEYGKVNTVVTSGRNITELKEYEKKINESLQKEKELNQLKSKFISAASHQFRTPLASILSSAQMIKRYANKWNQEKLNEHHERMYASIKNLTQLMDDVLLIGKSEEGKDSLKPEEADIEELFNKFIEEVKPLLNERQEISYKNRAGKKYMKLDKKALHQIMNNLLSNAVKYTPEGGKIKIETNLEEGKLKIIVEDEGIGIPKEEIKYIFDSFYRTTNAVNFPGTGLGLNIVKRIVDLYKGTIDVASGLNKGTKFTIILPINPVNE